MTNLGSPASFLHEEPDASERDVVRVPESAALTAPVKGRRARSEASARSLHSTQEKMLEDALAANERLLAALNCAHNNVPPDDPDNPWTYREYDGKTWNYCPECGLHELWEGGVFFKAMLVTEKSRSGVRDAE